MLEVGAKNYNGSIRGLFRGCAEYIGLDPVIGIGVDWVMPIEELEGYSGRFDIVVSTETFEHIFWWQLAIKNMERVLRCGGLLLLTTRSEGFPVHKYPEDYWRFRQRDFRIALKNSFHDVEIQSDPQFPGVFVAAWKT